MSGRIQLGLLVFTALVSAPPLSASLQTSRGSASEVAGDARAVLARLARMDGVRAAALERLSRYGGDVNAREELRKDAAGPGSQRTVALASLARLGDRAAAERLAELLASKPQNTVEIIETLGDAGAASAAPAVTAALASSDAEERVAAALALGRIGSRSALPTLESLSKDESPMVRTAGDVARWRLGDGRPKEDLETRMGMGVPELQLIAARAWAPETNGPWAAELLRLLKTESPGRRHQVAALLGRVRQAEVRQVIVRDLAPEVPAFIRQSAAAIWEPFAADEDVPLLRSLLDDPDPKVQVHAAGALLKLSGR